MDFNYLKNIHTQCGSRIKVSSAAEARAGQVRVSSSDN